MSKPVRLAFEANLIARGRTVLDYGCGRGDDLKSLAQNEIRCWGWDPVYAPDGARDAADVVNLGYVVNVIEDPSERREVLRDAWAKARQLLIVSSRLDLEASGLSVDEYADGCVTKWGTFQKFFSQEELRDFIDTTLEVSSVAAAPGIFFVFRDENLRHEYLSQRFQRSFRGPLVRQSDVLYEKHRELLDKLGSFVAQRGRLPDEGELAEVVAIRKGLGSIRRAFGILCRTTGKTQWDSIAEESAQGLLVFLALERFRGRPAFSELPRSLQLDIRALCGNYNRACDEADKLLFSAGQPNTREAACKKARVGKLTQEALYVHKSALNLLPAVLRVFEGCARVYVGEIEGANLIKFYRKEQKLSYLSYPTFDKDPHPALVGALLVDLKNLKLTYRRYADSDNPPILHRKEEFVAEDYPGREKFAGLTRQEENHGLYEETHTIGYRRGWQEALDAKGLRISGHRLLTRRA